MERVSILELSEKWMEGSHKICREEVSGTLIDFCFVSQVPVNACKLDELELSRL
jgi:hypothetical protein